MAFSSSNFNPTRSTVDFIPTKKSLKVVEESFHLSNLSYLRHYSSIHHFSVATRTLHNCLTMQSPYRTSIRRENQAHWGHQIARVQIKSWMLAQKCSSFHEIRLGQVLCPDVLRLGYVMSTVNIRIKDMVEGTFLLDYKTWDRARDICALHYVNEVSVAKWWAVSLPRAGEYRLWISKKYLNIFCYKVSLQELWKPCIGIYVPFCQVTY